MSYDPHSRVAASSEAIILRKRALALEMGLSDDDPLLTALAISQQEVAPKLYQVIAAGYGSVKVYIQDHWVATVAVEVTEVPQIENRKPKGWDPYRRAGVNIIRTFVLYWGIDALNVWL